jgi:hypothetical protein
MLPTPWATSRTIAEDRAMESTSADHGQPNRVVAVSGFRVAVSCIQVDVRGRPARSPTSSSSAAVKQRSSLMV